MKTANQIPYLPETDENGLLLDPEQWNEEIACTIASQHGIDSLSEEHWLVIGALRSYFKEFGVAPAMHHICHRHGKDKQWIHNLFGGNILFLTQLCIIRFPVTYDQQ